MSAVAIAVTGAGLTVKAARDAHIMNIVEANPNGVLPSFGDSDAFLPSLGLEAKGETTIDFSALIANLDIKKFEGGYDVKIADATIDNNARTTTNYSIQSSATLSAFGKELRVPLPKFNYDAHKYLEGSMRQQFYVPGDAVTGVSINGHTNVTIDASKLEMNASWIKTPSLTAYTVGKDGEMDFQDQTGLVEGYISSVAGVQTMFGFNNLKNTLNQMDSDSESYIIDSMLAIGAESCKDSFDEPLVAAIKDGYRSAAVDQFGVDPETLQIIVEGEPKISTHYEEPEDNSGTVLVADPSSDVDPKTERLRTETTLTNPPEEALKQEFSCDDADFDVVNGGQYE